MKRGGRHPRWSREQRERVIALAEEGASQREIAEVVFGDERFRGRVERILRPPAAASDASAAPRTIQADDQVRDDPRPESDLELFRELVSRAERAMLESTSPPLLSDIERLLRVKRQLDNLEALERANALARGLS
jgi:hypothetical protein